MAVLQPGTKLKHGTFEIVSLLGSGGFGEVYLGRQTRVDRDVAIKVLHPHIGENADMVVRFQREAFAAANLAHPHVLTIFDFDLDETAEAWFLAMQYVPGGRTLHDMLGPPRSVVETVSLIEGIAGALDAAHARGIVHRDVKPENIMLDENRALLTDFGIAHLTTMSSMTAIGVTIGTPAYMAPEQAMGERISARSDQYALAIIVYELLAGRLPFLGETVAVMIQHVSGEPPPLENFNPEISPSARAVVARALSKNPDDRFSSCMAFVDDLRAASLQRASSRGSAHPSASTAEPNPQLFPPMDRTVVRPRVASAAPPSRYVGPEAGRTVIRAAEVGPAPPPEHSDSSELTSLPTVIRPGPIPAQATVQVPLRPPEPYLQPGSPSMPVSDLAVAGLAPGADILSQGRSQQAPAAEPASMSPTTTAPARHVPSVAPDGVQRRQPILIVASVAVLVLVGLSALVVAGRALLEPRNEPGAAGQNPPTIQISPGVPHTVPREAGAPDPTRAIGMGTVRISSFPEGASIMMNGQPAGQAPRTLPLSPGEHTLTIASPSYEDWTQQVRVTKGQQMTVAAALTPLPALKALEIAQTHMGRDAYLDPGGTIRLGILRDTFTILDEVNAIVYLKPTSFRVRDLSFQATTRWQRAGGGPPLVLHAEQQVSRDWEETFVRACAPAVALDPRGSNVPLHVEILIDGELIAQFTYRIGPGNPAVAASTPCDSNALPSRIAALIPIQGPQVGHDRERAR